jgi:hypothetical protein
LDHRDRKDLLDFQEPMDKPEFQENQGHQEKAERM